MAGDSGIVESLPGRGSSAASKHRPDLRGRRGEGDGAMESMPETDFTYPTWL